MLACRRWSSQHVGLQEMVVAASWLAGDRCGARCTPHACGCASAAASSLPSLGGGRGDGNPLVAAAEGCVDRQTVRVVANSNEGAGIPESRRLFVRRQQAARRSAAELLAAVQQSMT
mmetsp:Transcript_41777/g.124964  ORF Transcript_41777/g.124964 Transcript_41777/m.124964 type:complete len:117 (+) Transcript_41777:1649-1999(+)